MPVGAALVAPHEAWGSWGGHAPAVVAVLLVATWWYVRGIDDLRRRGHGRLATRWRVGAWFAGVGVLLIALASPLDALAGTLFSAHMGQHVLLTTIAAPLLALASPTLPVRFGLPGRLRTAADGLHRRARPLRRATHTAAWPLLAAAGHAAVYWLWHLPGPYEAALRSEAVHLLEHATMLGTGFVLWAAILQSGRHSTLGYGTGIAAVFVTALAHGALGAVLTFAPHVLYGHYLTGPPLWGMSPIDDQHMAGVIMWAPSKVVHGVAVLVLAIAWLQAAERRARAREATPDAPRV